MSKHRTIEPSTQDIISLLSKTLMKIPQDTVDLVKMLADFTSERAIPWICQCMHICNILFSSDTLFSFQTVSTDDKKEW